MGSVTKGYFGVAGSFSGLQRTDTFSYSITLLIIGSHKVTKFKAKNYLNVLCLFLVSCMGKIKIGSGFKDYELKVLIHSPKGPFYVIHAEHNPSVLFGHKYQSKYQRDLQSQL
jgi:hypothetical protein